MTRLPTTSPPRDSYAEVVASDDPAGYWPLVDDATTAAIVGAPGPTFTMVAGTMYNPGSEGGVVGEPGVTGYVQLQKGEYATAAMLPGDAGDVGGLSEAAVEGFFSMGGTLGAGGTATLVAGPLSAAAIPWRLYISNDTYAADFRNAAGTLYTVATGSRVASAWDHIAAVAGSGTLSIYLNGAVAATTAFVGPFAAIDANATLQFGHSGGTSPFQTVSYDEVAVYRHALTATRVQAHYDAARNRGFRRGDFCDERAAKILDVIDSTAPRSLRHGSHEMTGAYMVGQSALEELRACRDAESVDAMLFIGRDGTIVLRDAAHRSQSPWNTSQGTFGDGASELPYTDLSVDYSDSFLSNDWNVSASTNTAGPQNASDATSIAQYGKRTTNVTLPIIVASEAAVVANSMLAKYKNPMLRITSITPKVSDPDTAANVFARDLGDRITVVRRPPGGGTITQSVFIQKITVDGDPSTPWPRVRWGLSPL